MTFGRLKIYRGGGSCVRPKGVARRTYRAAVSTTSPADSRTPTPPSTPPAAVWTDADLSRSPHDAADKQERVRRMFASIARSYDINNRVHSLWQDQAWRRAAVRAAGCRPTDHVLDVACGTGDLAEHLARAGVASVVGLDYTAEMLDLARVKAARRTDARKGIRFIQGDAQALPMADASVDVVSIAFGIRNVQVPAKAVGEFFRVLRPGGRLVILEFAEPTFAPVRWFNNLYCRRIMPVTATLISRDRSGAYRYLPKSVATFITPDEMRSMLAGKGFAGVTVRGLSLGICNLYRAVKP
jgi:demethylmenaquinone methyltransferase / 2-methoxy-6-polyprenyl-1,4-benzoquinol methylase